MEITGVDQQEGTGAEKVRRCLERGRGNVTKTFRSRSFMFREL